MDRGKGRLAEDEMELGLKLGPCKLTNSGNSYCSRQPYIITFRK